MKKQINPNIQAHLIRGAYCLLTLVAMCAIPFAIAQRNVFKPEAATDLSQRMLTFEERVSYQRAIEEVYWRHRIWPKERPDPKPPLDAVMSQAQLEKKVADYLRNSQALQDYWQRQITAEQLQAEMDRMAQHSKQPEVLRELFEALGNDPFVIAECLARPALAERFVAGLSAQDIRVRRESTLITDLRSTSTALVLVNGAYTLPKIPDQCTDDVWATTTTTNAPDGRSEHAAVWTGSEMIVWGGIGPGLLSTGGKYDPTTDSWTATSTTDAPEPRYKHTAIWTGSEMIVWGGFTASAFSNTGGKYNPITDSWTATSVINAPVGRKRHTAVWSGNEMIVWGGCIGPNIGCSGTFNTGGRYNPSTDSWIATSTDNALNARAYHTAIWTGSQMIVWGGGWNTGGKYNPNTDTWTATSTVNAPAQRSSHSAVWTDSEMIVWGGGFLNTGGGYDPNTDSWRSISTISAPDGREFHTAVWTGSEMIVWGGDGLTSRLNTGGRYNPSADSWTATNTTNAPDVRAFHTAVWTGGQMIVWGGRDQLNTGGRYCAAAPSLTPTPRPSSTPRRRPTPAPRP